MKRVVREVEEDQVRDKGKSRDGRYNKNGQVIQMFEEEEASEGGNDQREERRMGKRLGDEKRMMVDDWEKDF